MVVIAITNYTTDGKLLSNSLTRLGARPMQQPFCGLFLTYKQLPDRKTRVVTDVDPVHASN